MLNKHVGYNRIKKRFHKNCLCFQQLFEYVLISTPCSISKTHGCCFKCCFLLCFQFFFFVCVQVTCDATGQVLCLGPEYRASPSIVPFILHPSVLSSPHTKKELYYREILFLRQYLIFFQHACSPNCRFHTCWQPEAQTN